MHSHVHKLRDWHHQLEANASSVGLLLEHVSARGHATVSSSKTSPLPSRSSEAAPGGARSDEGTAGLGREPRHPLCKLESRTSSPQAKEGNSDLCHFWLSTIIFSSQWPSGLLRNICLEGVPLWMLKGFSLSSPQSSTPGWTCYLGSANETCSVGLEVWREPAETRLIHHCGGRLSRQFLCQNVV